MGRRGGWRCLPRLQPPGGRQSCVDAHGVRVAGVGRLCRLRDRGRLAELLAVLQSGRRSTVVSELATNRPISLLPSTSRSRATRAAPAETSMPRPRSPSGRGCVSRIVASSRSTDASAPNTTRPVSTFPSRSRPRAIRLAGPTNRIPRPALPSGSGRVLRIVVSCSSTRVPPTPATNPSPWTSSSSRSQLAPCLPRRVGALLGHRAGPTGRATASEFPCRPGGSERGSGVALLNGLIWPAGGARLARSPLRRDPG